MKPSAAMSRMLDQVASDCVAVRVRTINRVVSALYDEALRPHGLRVSQANLLVAIARMGSARPVDICRGLRLEKSTLSRDVDVMKRQGWLESEPPTGGRNQRLSVTPTGVKLLNEILPAWARAQKEVCSLLGEANIDALRRIADTIGFAKLDG
jgi:DNA-binding MarR family transcriptional regulator